MLFLSVILMLSSGNLVEGFGCLNEDILGLWKLLQGLGFAS